MKKVFLSLSFLLCLGSVPLGADDFGRELEPGLFYQKMEEPVVHLFRVNLDRFRPEVLRAQDSGQVALSARRYRERSGALLVINGGFFDEKFGSLGLLVQKGKQVNPLRKTSWGIFCVEGGVPAILASAELKKTLQPEMAIQVGPRLVASGKVLKMKDSSAAPRSAIGVLDNRNILLAVAETPILLKDWAGLLQKQAGNVLNLDGGGSTQISVKAGDFSLQVNGDTGVPNAIGIFQK